MVRVGSTSSPAPGDFLDAVVIADGPVTEVGSFGALISVNGHVKGVICVAGQAGYTEADLQVMSVLSQAASVLFDAHVRQEQEERMEERLRQSAKMEAIGVLAGGVAHDFNNMLMAILGNAQLALEYAAGSPKVAPKLSRIIGASRRLGELCKQLLAYAGRGPRSTQRIDCNNLVDELGELQKLAISKKATLSYELSPEAVYVEADPAQLNQVVLNFITNASEAIGDNEGEILVSTAIGRYSREQLDQFQADADLKPGLYATVAVSDTGCGMDAEEIAKVFDPFYTTKTTGHGLGLAAVLGIVRDHRGAIRLQSELGKGSTFTVSLPASTTRDASEPRFICAVDRAPTGKQILVIDDEAEVRHIHSEMLEYSGFSVITASDGREGVDIFARKADQIDCVLLDLSMPKLDGGEVFQELRRIKADIPVILASGFAEQELLDRFSAAGLSQVLQKPVDMATLVTSVRAVLELTNSS